MHWTAMWHAAEAECNHMLHMYHMCIIMLYVYRLCLGRRVRVAWKYTDTSHGGVVHVKWAAYMQMVCRLGLLKE